ncbi:hypothetical protein ICW40_09205 [Actinotalea ferrariae]|nr:hypothetical protein [Actinotalea ferrariae]
MFVPSDQEFLEELGVQPEPIDEYGGRVLRFVNADRGEALQLTYDLMEQIVAYRWWVDGVLVADVVRDAVTDLRIVGMSRTSVEARYGVPDYHGVLVIDIHPRVIVTDQVLRGSAS